MSTDSLFPIPYLLLPSRKRLFQQTLISLADVDRATIGRNPLLGNFLAFIGAWASSLYLFLGSQARTRGFNIEGYITVVYGIAAVVLLPISFVSGIRHLLK